MSHPVFAWMCEYASVLLNRFEVGKDLDDGVRTEQAEESQGSRLGIWRSIVVEGEAIKRKPRQVVLLVGRRRVLGSQVHNGRGRDRY